MLLGCHLLVLILRFRGLDSCVADNREDLVEFFFCELEAKNHADIDEVVPKDKAMVFRIISTVGLFN